MSSVQTAQLGSFNEPLPVDSSLASMTSAFPGLAYPASQFQMRRNSVNGLESLLMAGHTTGAKAHVDMRGQGLTHLPALGNEKAIQAIDLSKNSIASLESAPEDLPEDLKSLSLASNRLSDLCQLKYLTACTALVDLDVSDNTVADAAVRIGFDLRPFVLFLLPGLQRLNGQSVRQPQLIEASRALFTDGRGQLSDRLLEMLEEGRQVELTHYLMQQCSLVKRARHVDTAPNTSRGLPSSQTPRNPQTLSYDDVPVGGGAARRGTSYSAAPSGQDAGQDTFSGRRKGDMRGMESAPVSPRNRDFDSPVMGSGGFGGMPVVMENTVTPRQRTNGAFAARNKAGQSREQETGMKNGVRVSLSTSPRGATERARVAAKTLGPDEGVKSIGTLQKARGRGAVTGPVSGRSTSRAHEAPEESSDRHMEKEMVKRLVTAELLATSSSSQVESLAGNVHGQSRELLDVREELSGVRKDLQQSRTQGHQELAEVWAELTQVRTDLRDAHAAAEQARTELGQVRAELGQVQTELESALAKVAGGDRDAAASRAQYEGVRAELADARTEADAVRTTLGAVRTEMAAAREEWRAGAEARAVLDEALRRMWAECLHLRAWKDAQERREAERAAGRVQRVWRAWRAREEKRRIEEKLRPHVVKIQALARGFLQRRRTSKLRVRSAAAVLIQAAVRGCIQRKRFRAEILNERKEQWAMQEREMLRAQLYQMQLWMHQMATAIASAPPVPVPSR